MKNFLLNRIRQGEFDPNPNFNATIVSLNTSYVRAKENVERMHKGDELTITESCDREFRYYGSEMNRVLQSQHHDEQKKMFELRSEFYKLFGVDVWDEVILNCEFDTLEELYNCVKLYVKEHYAD